MWGFSASIIKAVALSLGFLLSANAATNDTSSGFYVGAAKVDITPAPNPLWMPLNEFPNEKLYVRAIVFENNGVRGAFISAELSFLQGTVYTKATNAVAALLNTEPSNLAISVTHTHGAAVAGSGPSYGSGAVGPYDSLADAAVAAVQAALIRLEPAKVGYSTGSLDLNVNRDAIDPLSGRWTQAANYSAPVDREVEVLTFARVDGSIIASYTSYAMHPIQSYLSGYTSADWPGAMSYWVEKAFGNGMIAMYSQQASGDVSPRWRRTGTNNLASMHNVPITGLELVQEPVEEPIRDNLLPIARPDIAYTRELYQELIALGTIVGEETIRIISYTTYESSSNLTLWSKKANVTCPGRVRLDSEREGVPGLYVAGPDITVQVGAIAFGNIAIVTIGGEIYTRIGWKIKEMAPLNKTMIVAMTQNGGSGYICDTESWNHETFEVLASSLQPGDCMTINIPGNLTALVTEYKNTILS